MGKSTINGHFQQLCQFTRGYSPIYTPEYLCRNRLDQKVKQGPAPRGNICTQLFIQLNAKTHMYACIPTDICMFTCIGIYYKVALALYVQYIHMYAHTCRQTGSTNIQKQTHIYIYFMCTSYLCVYFLLYAYLFIDRCVPFFLACRSTHMYIPLGNQTQQRENPL